AEQKRQGRADEPPGALAGLAAWTLWRRAGLLGGLKSVDHLAEDLRFADHQGVETGGHTTEMAHSLFAREVIGVLNKALRVHVVQLRQKIDQHAACIGDARI